MDCVNCPHYHKATKYPRACYYEPQCWMGFWKIVKFIIGVK